MTLIRLPVSNTEVRMRALTGAEDLLLQEAPGVDTDTALALAARIGKRPDGETIDWPSTPVTDLDAFLLMLRRMAAGDHIHTDVRCLSVGCGARIDVAFGITDYLAHHAPAQPRGVEPSAEPDWFRYQDSGALFRFPTGADLAAVAGRPDIETALAARCIRPAGLPARTLRRVEAAMAAMAPPLAGSVQGDCPECGAKVAVLFDPQQYVLMELRIQAALIYEDVHLIAASYHWSEDAILSLPSARRTRYAALAREQRSSI